MERAQHKPSNGRKKWLVAGLSGLVALLLVAIAFTGAVAADLTDTDTVDVETEDENDTVVVDLEFNQSFTDNTSATVTISDSNGTVNSSTVSVNSSDFDGSDDTIWKTVEFEPGTGNYTVSLSADDPGAINSTNVKVESATAGGIIAGANQTHLAAFAVVVVALIVAKNREMI